jgi:hypothetical protein
MPQLTFPRFLQVMAMSAGTIDDFHRGLADRIGAPNLDFEQTMRLEHCDKSGCDVYFSASNYNVTTTPRKEWLYIVGGDNVRSLHGFSLSIDL